MGLNFEPECQAAIDLAKRAAPEGAELDILTLLSALYHCTRLKSQFPHLADILDPPIPLRQETPEKVRLASDLQRIFQELARSAQRLRAEPLFLRLIQTDAGRQALRNRGLRESDLLEMEAILASAIPSWRQSPERLRAIQALSTFGRMLTASEPPLWKTVAQDKVIRALVRILSKMERHNAIIVGYPGTGKSAAVYELARRIFHNDPTLPARIRDLDIFELSPSFLRSGASFVGQYDERVKSLIEILQAYPKIILFVDEMHSFFQSSVYERGPFSDANETFKGVLALGQIACIGCTTPSEYRRFIEPDQALARRFEIIRLEPPTPEQTLAILRDFRPKMERFYYPLRIPDPILQKAVDLSEEFLPARYQPDKAIQLLDEACALCATSNPPLSEVTEETLRQCLEDMIGHGLIRQESLTFEKVYQQLNGEIIGQDEVLKDIARAFVAGFSTWLPHSGPRGVFLFGGPTGVGKTETALSLAKILGNGVELLIRVDCNLLPASAHNREPAMHILLGVPPGYVGYARGQGGLLSKIRDLPECIVLFDEFEKAGATVGEVLLQIVDTGKVEDVDGNLLDFRRAFIIFTTNVGCDYGPKVIGFGDSGRGSFVPKVEAERVGQELRRLGLGEEFLARLSHVFLFRGLDQEAVKAVLRKQLGKFQTMAELRGLSLDCPPEVVAYLAARWQPRFGVRYLLTALRHRLIEQLGVAEAQGDLRGVKVIRLQVMAIPEPAAPLGLSGLSAYERHGDTLVIYLA